MKHVMLGFSIGIVLIMLQCCANSNGQQDSIVVQIGNEVFTTTDLTTALKRIPKNHRFEYLTEDGKKMLVDMMIDWKLFSKEAEKTGLHKTPAIKSRLEANTTKTIFKEQMLSTAYLQYLIQKMQQVTDAEIENYFYRHKDSFTLPERIRVKRIFFDTKDKALNALIVLGTGASFEEYKQQNPQTKIKIDTLWLNPQAENSALERAASSLNLGEISDVLATKTGYCLIRIEDKTPGRERTLEEVRESIKVRLNEKRKQELVEHTRKELRRGVNITINTHILGAYQCKECS